MIELLLALTALVSLVDKMAGSRLSQLIAEWAWAEDTDDFVDGSVEQVSWLEGSEAGSEQSLADNLLDATAENVFVDGTAEKESEERTEAPKDPVKRNATELEHGKDDASKKPVLKVKECRKKAKQNVNTRRKSNRQRRAPERYTGEGDSERGSKKMNQNVTVRRKSKQQGRAPERCVDEGDMALKDSAQNEFEVKMEDCSKTTKQNHITRRKSNRQKKAPERYTS